MKRQRQQPRKPLSQRSYHTLGWWCLAVYLWGLTIFTLLRIDPIAIIDVGIEGMYLPLQLVLFGAVWTTVGLIRNSVIKGLVWATAITGFLSLRFAGIGHVVNALLIGGLVASVEYYWQVSQRYTPPIDS